MQDFDTTSSSENDPLLKRSSNTYDTTSGTILKWNNVSYFVDNKQILNNISGYAKRGEVLGIIGSSGSGKTTLVSILTGKLHKISSLKHKNQNSILTGKILFKNYIGSLNNNKNNPTLNILSNNVSIVLQEDLLYQTETVKEAIEFSAVMRNRNKSYRQRIDIADKVIDDLELEDCVETWIGGDRFRGISGGERKRVSLGIELVKSSELLFLDEPTTGLDSNIAFNLMKTLKNICKNKHSSIVCTLHQPSTEIFKLLDRVMVISSGQVVFQGYTNTLVKYLLSINYICPKYSNVSDYMIRKINKSPNTFINKWNNKKNKFKQTTKYEYTINESDEIRSNLNHIIIQDDYFMSPIQNQLYYLFLRTLKIAIRDPQLFAAKLAPFFILAFASVIWSNIKPLNRYDFNKEEYAKALNDAENKYSTIFSVTAFLMLQTLLMSMLTFQQYKIIFEKERASNYYYSVLWLLSKSTIDVIITLTGTLIMMAIGYGIVSFHATFAQMYFIGSLLVLNADSLGLIVGCTVNSLLAGAIMSGQIFISCFVTSNYLIRVVDLRWYIRWFAYINPIYYSVQMMATNEFNNINEYSEIIIKDYHIKVHSYYLYAYLLILFFIVFRITAFCILVYKNGW